MDRLPHPATGEPDYTEDDLAFMKAMHRYKIVNRRPFPTWSEVLEVLKSLGYRKVALPEPLPKRNTRFERESQIASIRLHKAHRTPPKPHFDAEQPSGESSANPD